MQSLMKEQMNKLISCQLVALIEKWTEERKKNIKDKFQQGPSQ
jgi:hypothetical protein